MPNDPSSPYNRHSIRLPTYDYSEPGAYFVTIVTHQRDPLFGEIVHGQMHLNAWGQIVQDVWDEIPAHFPNVALDEFIIMPNHIHAIININFSIPATSVGAQHAAPLHAPLQNAPLPPTAAPLHAPLPNVPHPIPHLSPIKSGSLPAIVRSFKSAVTNKINKIDDSPGTPIWQRNYYEHIIRDQPDLDQIRLYIQENPSQWETDSENTTPTP